MIEIGPLDLADVLHVCRKMRLQDWREVLNLLPLSVTTPDVVAMIVMNVSKVGFVAKIDGVPAGVIQVSEPLDGNLRFGLFGTDDFELVAMPLCLKLMEIMPDLIEEGAVYGEAFADAIHTDAHKLLEFLGFKKRAILERYGSHGCDVALFTITKDQANVYGRRWGKLHTRASTSFAAGDSGDRSATAISQRAGESSGGL